MFDVRTGAWIPVLEADGSVTEVGLIDLMSRAHELRDLATQTPLEYVAVVRLLVAIVHRALDGPRTLDQGQALYREGRVPAEVIDYLQSDAGVWDLFDTDRPWLQAPTAIRDSPAESPLSRLLPWEPTGNNPVFWEHTYDAAPPSLSAAQAALALAVAHPFSLSGLAGPGRPNFTDGTLAGVLACVAIGESLAHTILLNAVRYTHDAPMPRGGDDAPAWERVERPPIKERTLVSGYVDFLTLTTRRVLLLAEADGTVSRCHYARGLAPRDIGARDPFVPYYDTPKGVFAMAAKANRSLWRDLPGITSGLVSDTRRESTGVLAWATRLSGGSPVRLRAVGIVRKQRAKVDNVVDGELRIPARIATSVDHRFELDEAVKLAEETEKALLRSLRTFAELAGTGAEEARTIAGRLLAATTYWAALEVPYDGLVQELSQLDVDALEDLLQRWSARLRVQARRAYEDGAGMLGCSPREIVAAARARNQLEGWVRKHLPESATTGVG